MPSIAKSLNMTSILAGLAAGAGGYYIGSSMDSTTPPTSPLSSKEVLIPGAAGVVGYFLLKRKKASVAKGLLIGGLIGAAYGYYKQSQGATGGAGSPYAGAASAYLGRSLGAPGRGVRRTLNSPTGSGIGRRMGRMGSIVPKNLQSGSSAFPADAWKRG